MKTTNVSYHKVFNLENYSNEKIQVDLQLEPGDDPQTALNKARDFVENQHQLSKQKQRYLQSCEILNDADSYTGRQLKQAKEQKDSYEAMLTNTPKLLS